MTKKVLFEMPVSKTKQWQGKLDVYATIDGTRHDYEIEFSNIIYEDRAGRRSNVTALIENFCDVLYESLKDIASGYIEDDEEDMTTLNKQDWE